MSAVRPERVTQNRVIANLCNQLGYTYLGDWSKKPDNRCVEHELLSANLKARGYSAAHINQALKKLLDAAELKNTTLYQTNMRTYQLLRYGVSVQIGASAPHETVHLIDWENPEINNFALAEEVTLKGGHERRPDIVLYVNGIALVVIELKRGSKDIAEGIRQLITNQEDIFNAAFFATVQFVLAGNDSQGLRYGTTGSPENLFVEWKHHKKGELVEGSLLDEPLAQMANKERLLDLIRNFIIFDAGRKKVPRLHQYEGIKAAQERIKKQEGGVIWHTQGSGKSILMVLLAKWLLEHDPEARILVITDRDELDKQIEGVMRNAGVIGESAPPPRITSRRELIEKLGRASPRLLCALLHKINPKDLKGEPPRIVGRFYVFVDECHRSQGGNMNKQMKRWFSTAIFIGFTGTPLLRKDKQTTHEVFGTYIHTYKFDEAVADKVVLDLKYEARNVPQRLTSQKEINDWFSNSTRALNNFQKAILRKRWATMEELMSSEDRKSRIVANIIHDFGVKPRLNNDRGTAILVAASIYDACHYFRLFKSKNFGDYCGIVTSYEPNHNAISREPKGSDERYKFDTYTKWVLAKDQTTKQYEDEAKRQFKEEPANLKLLIVVSKLLTGFDAPSCTYIYLDNELRDHNLFQAICRTNRLDGEDKDYGYIVDYKELIESVQTAIAVYTSDELDVDDTGDNGNIELKDWLKEGKTRLEAAREALLYLCEPVPSPKELEQYLLYFCGDAQSPTALNDTEQLRVNFYKTVASFIRAYADIASNLADANYSAADIARLEKEVEFFTEIRSAMKKHSGEELDIKPFEADMRHLINTYIQADAAAELGNLSSLSLTELIIETGIHNAIAKNLNAKGKLSRNAIAEGIVNNVRKTIIRDQLTDPRFYAEMSQLLDDLIRQKREETISYEEFLKRMEALAKKLAKGHASLDIPIELLGNQSAIAVYNNLPDILAREPILNAIHQTPADYGDKRLQLTLKIDQVMREEAPAVWKDDPAREAQVLNALYPVMDKSKAVTQALFDLIKNIPGY